MTVIVIDDERKFVAQHCAPHRADSELLLDGEFGYLRLVDALEAGEEIDELWLDHDLGLTDIRPVVLFLEEAAHYGTPLLVKQIYIHTQNPVGARWMEAGLAKYNTLRVDPMDYGLLDHWDEFEKDTRG